MVLDYSTLENILAKIRTVKYGDYVLAEDHNYQTDAIKELKKLLSQLDSHVDALEIPSVINDLQDVEAPSPTNKELLIFESATDKWKNKPLSVFNIDELGNVEAPSPTNKDLLGFDTASGKWKNRPFSDYLLDELGNVEITTPTDGQILTYESATDTWKNKDPKIPSQVEISFVSNEALDSISETTPTDTTTRSITVSLPTEASIVRAMLIAIITAMNDTANTQKISLNVQARVSGGTWTSVFNQTNCMGLPAVDGATASMNIPQDASSIITTEGTYEFKITVTQTSANAVRYTTIYALIITYEVS